MNDPLELEYRKAVEALRSGVPNHAVAKHLGTTQEKIEERFLEALQENEEGVLNQIQVPGLLIDGNFGSGKSHLLEHLRWLAKEKNYVCSKVVISKETPLFDLHKIFRSAVDQSELPQIRGNALTEAVLKIPNDTQKYTKFYRWASDPDSGLNDRFPASLHLYGKLQNDSDVCQRLVSFWSGDPITKSELKKYLKYIEAKTMYNITGIVQKELAFQRFKFIARLFTASGYSGWVLLLDEVELMGRYSILQRARAYADLAVLCGKIENQGFPGLITAAAITSDYGAVFFDKKDDENAIVKRLAEKLEAKEPALISQAMTGIRMIQKESLPLDSPTKEQIHETYGKIKEMYGKAFDFEPPELSIEYAEASKGMRQYVRRWIQEWDLKRLYPYYSPDIEEKEIKMDYEEDAALEEFFKS